MNKARKTFYAVMLASCIFSSVGCVPKLQQKKENTVMETIPSTYGEGMAADSTAASTDWSAFFDDAKLVALIDEALENNQELHIMDQEIQMANNEVKARGGEILPRAGVGVDGGVPVPGRYAEEPGRAGPLNEAEGEQEGPRFGLGLYATWEVDIWKKLRNAQQSARYHYLASVEGRNFATTVLVAEIASSYYELMALDARLEVIHSNIDLMQNSLKIVRLQKEAAKVTELAVQRFEAEVLKNQSLQYEVMQEITQVENRINLLLGRYPQKIERDSGTFLDREPKPVSAGVPTDLLENRPDIKQAEYHLEAAKLDVKVARSTFYPSLVLDAGIGYREVDLEHLLPTPKALILGTVASLFSPLVNRRSIKANYASANAAQIQAVYHYERAVLSAFVECSNLLSLMDNLSKSYELRVKQVEKLNSSVKVSNTLFQSARADYLEVLTTRREALESQLELVDTKEQQMLAMVGMYRALGGGWKNTSSTSETTK